jgi:hypothetical protein
MRLTEKVHTILTNHLHEGDLAIDATAGNGYDTLFLAEAGRVIGKGHRDRHSRLRDPFDTRKLESAGLSIASD